MKTLLDRPVWSALNTRHADLALGEGPAKRYPSAIVPFASTADDSEPSLAALAALVGPDDSVILAQADPIVLPTQLVATMQADAVQMVAEQRWAPFEDDRIGKLGADDAAEMLALATLTKPGPFAAKARSLGDFWGIKIDGRLAAMAGQRMAQPGLTELSGVCTHPDFRGKGFGRLMSLYVAGQIFGRGETAYLHAYANNAPAIGLYETIGFRLRSAINVAVVHRKA